MEEVKNQIIRLIELDDLDKARRMINQLEQDTYLSTDVYFLNALYYIKIRNFDNAWLWLWRGLYDYPEDPILNEWMAEILNLQGRKQESYSFLENISKIGNTFKYPTDLIPNNRFNAVYDQHHLPPHTLKNKLRVLQGTMEIANQMNTLSNALSKMGVYSKTFNYYPFYLNYQSDYTWPLIGYRSSPLLNNKQRKLAEDILPNFDLFHFHFGTSMTFDYSDLPLYRQNNKTVIMHHWGSDIRLLSKALELNPYSLVKNQDEIQIQNRLNILTENISHCIVPDMELYQYVKNYYENVYVIPSMINVDSYVPSIQKQSSHSPLLIVHAPTSPFIKGTPYILKAIETLKCDYQFDFQLIQGMSHTDAKKLYQKADLIIDQLHIGSYGLLAVEAMAMGKPVICWISPFMREHYPSDLPIISANPDTITNVLENILKNQDLLQELGLKGRKYIEKHHDYKKNSLKVLELYYSIHN
ncbi:glycosyltransferase [Heyndrickxia camelliae]|uniref:Transferase n=1 Tax=Heyndrickxia camelliae TaxID=1707093 RepID=A0A2N3LQJ5_9BACI|nr:glycosyltransferase [Heyndrickxia camelliae]PKR86804.1 transferase [Heyndrickxia camelliae]